MGRGQGAFEYLMAYGWAILVVMLVGGAFWQLGIMAQHTGMSVIGFTYFKIVEVASGVEGGVATLVLQNTLPLPVTILPEESYATDATNNQNCTLTVNPTVIQTGGMFKVTTNCTTPIPQAYALQFKIKYHTDRGGARENKQETGTIKGTSATGASGTTSSYTTTTTGAPIPCGYSSCLAGQNCCIPSGGPEYSYNTRCCSGATPDCHEMTREVECCPSGWDFKENFFTHICCQYTACVSPLEPAECCEAGGGCYTGGGHRLCCAAGKEGCFGAGSWFGCCDAGKCCNSATGAFCCPTGQKCDSGTCINE